VVHIIERDKAAQAGADMAPGSSGYVKYLEQISKNILVTLLDKGLPAGTEYDADARGTKYAHAAGYPADGLERFLVKLGQATDQGATSRWSSTHPPVKDRNDRLQKQITGNNWQDTDRPRLAERLAMAKVALPKAASPKPGS